MSVFFFLSFLCLFSKLRYFLDTSSTDDNSEDVSDELFKCRHDRHEILEKKKYMSYMERNMNKRSGAR